MDLNNGPRDNEICKRKITNDWRLLPQYTAFVLINCIYCNDFLGALKYNPSISWRKIQKHRFFFQFPQILPPKCFRLRKKKVSFEATSELEVQSAA